jgi:hypothetical protein
MALGLDIKITLRHVRVTHVVPYEKVKLTEDERY